MFPELDARSWLTGRPEASLYDLSPAALAADADPEPSERPAALADAPTPPAGVSVETLLATEYGIHPEQVVLTGGADAARFVAFAAALELTDGGALVESPAAETLVRPPEALGAEVRRFERSAPDYGLGDPPVGNAAVVALSNRHDPSGRLLDRAPLEDAAESAASAGAWLLVDENCAPLAESGDALGGVTAAGAEKTAVVGSFERLPGLAALEVGWVVGPPAFAEAARRVDRYFGGVAGPSRSYALRALHDSAARIERATELCRENSAALAASLAERPDTDCRVFADAPVATLSVEGFGGTAVANAAWEEGVLVGPGEFYGMSDAVRLGLGRSPARVRAALDAFGGVLDDLAERRRTGAGTNP